MKNGQSRGRTGNSRVRVMGPDGMELITWAEFRRRFRARYIPTNRQVVKFSKSAKERLRKTAREQARLLKEVPRIDKRGRTVRQRLEAKFRRWNFPDCLAHVEARLLYEKLLAEKRTADVYVGFVSDKVGFGLYAGSEIKRGAFIGEYSGVLTRYKGNANHYQFTFGPDEEQDVFDPYVIDALPEGNYCRFANHASWRVANADPVYLFHRGQWHVILVAMKRIRRGQQIVYDYGDDYWDDAKGRPKSLRP